MKHITNYLEPSTFGRDPRRVQQLLGHSTLSTTHVYLQFKDEDVREGYNKIAF